MNPRNNYGQADEPNVRRVLHGTRSGFRSKLAKNYLSPYHIYQTDGFSPSKSPDYSPDTKKMLADIDDALKNLRSAKVATKRAAEDVSRVPSNPQASIQRVIDTGTSNMLNETLDSVMKDLDNAIYILKECADPRETITEDNEEFEIVRNPIPHKRRKLSSSLSAKRGGHF